MYRFISAVVLGLLIPCATSQSNVARCFQFTWLGPRYNNESIFANATCSDATMMASGVPCYEPLVVSYDGSWPDVNYIWANHGQDASCILASNDVCATYTYYFDGDVENSTYMCTRAVDGNGQAIRSGCYTQENGSYVTKACFCQSIQGGMPCNGSGTPGIITSSMVVALAAIVLKILPN